MRVFARQWIGRRFAHNFGTRTATGMCSISIGMQMSGTGTTIGSTMIGTLAMCQVFPQLSSFLPRPLGGGVFYKLARPPAEHSPYFIQRFGKYDVLLVLQRFHLPHNEKQYFYRIQFSYCNAHVWHFFCFWKICCNCSCLDNFYK